MPGGGGREPLVVDMVSAVRAAAFLCGVISRGGRGRGARSSQPYLGPRGGGRCPGDMMIDWVSPACGDAAAQSNQAVRLALWQGRQRLTADRRELAAVVPIG